MVYAVFVSLGFAAFENVQYVFHYGLSVALPRALWAGYLSAVALHGCYDACAMNGGRLATILFVLFVALLYFAVLRRVKREAAHDQPA